MLLIKAFLVKFTIYVTLPIIALCSINNPLAILSHFVLDYVNSDSSWTIVIVFIITLSYIGYKGLTIFYRRVYNWSKYKPLSPSLLFSYRLYIELDSKLPRLASNFGLTFTRSRWVNYAKNNISLSLKLSSFSLLLLRYFFLLLFFLPPAYICFNYSYLLTNHIFFYFWSFKDIILYFLGLITFFTNLVLEKTGLLLTRWVCRNSYLIPSNKDMCYLTPQKREKYLYYSWLKGNTNNMYPNYSTINLSELELNLEPKLLSPITKLFYGDLYRDTYTSVEHLEETYLRCINAITGAERTTEHFLRREGRHGTLPCEYTANKLTQIQSIKTPYHEKELINPKTAFGLINEFSMPASTQQFYRFYTASHLDDIHKVSERDVDFILKRHYMLYTHAGIKCRLSLLWGSRRLLNKRASDFTLTLDASKAKWEAIESLEDGGGLSSQKTKDLKYKNELNDMSQMILTLNDLKRDVADTNNRSRRFMRFMRRRAQPFQPFCTLPPHPSKPLVRSVIKIKDR